MRLLTAICIAALVVCFAAAAFAETQNVKVSGDLGVSFVYQNDIDFNNNDSGNQNFFIQQVGLNVEADLTDNVSTFVRVLNEREWNAEDQNATGGNVSDYGFDILLDEGYVTLKEMLYAPLTVKIGRQNIWLGKGFVMGNAGALVWNTGAGLQSTIAELSEMTAFDAIRATLDYDPWTIDLIYSKIDSNSATIYDDVNLYVANVGYKFTKYDAEAEAYYIYKHNRSNIRTANIRDTDAIHTVGLRGSFVPFENMNVWAEGAYQFGDYRGSATIKPDRSAGAVDVGGNYTFTNVKWTPMLGAEFEWLSGEDAGQGGDWEAWDPIYRGKFDTYIADFLEITKITDQGAQIAGNDNGQTNVAEVAVIGGFKPMTDINVDGRWTFQWYDEVPVSGRSDEKGHELDAKVTYDYTEDVQFTVAGGIYWPLAYYPAETDSAATQIVSAVKVDF